MASSICISCIKTAISRFCSMRNVRIGADITNGIDAAGRIEHFQVSAAIEVGQHEAPLRATIAVEIEAQKAIPNGRNC